MSDIDLLIVGGGILGHMAALRACEAAPGATVVLAERDLPAGGASARSAGLHFPLGYSAVTRAASRASQAYHEALRRAWPEAPIVPLGLTIHCDPAREAWLEGLFAPEARLTRRPGAPGAWTAMGAHRADVAGLVRLIRRRLAGRVRFLDGFSAERIEPTRTGVAVAFADGTTLTSAKAIMAPGPWALDEPFRPFTAGLGLRIKKVVAAHVAAPPAAREPDVALFVGDDAFLMPRAGSADLLFSFTRLEWDVHPDRMARGLDAADREAAEAVLARNAPDLGGRVRGGQAFCDAYSPERAPVVTRVDETGRLVFAGAANGSGYRLAPAMAAEALRLLSFQPEPTTRPRRDDQEPSLADQAFR